MNNGNDSVVTLVNVIEIAADQVDSFVDGWRERAGFMRTQPGFRDYQLHRALLADSRFQLINIARWDSAEAFQAATADPEFRKQMQALIDTGLQVTGHPALYHLVLEAHGDGADGSTPSKAAGAKPSHQQ